MNTEQNTIRDLTPDEQSAAAFLDSCLPLGAATYSPEDNKLRLYPEGEERLAPEVYERFRAAGFRWAPVQKLFVCPRWTPTAEDLLIEYCGEITAEESTLADRAEAKAERLDLLSEKRARDADAFASHARQISERFAGGQPILLGHHSQRRAERDRDKMNAAQARAVKASELADYWGYRAEGVERFANMKNAPGVRARRIKTLLADLRTWQRRENLTAHAVDIWQGLEEDEPAPMPATLGEELEAIWASFGPADDDTANETRKAILKDAEGHDHERAEELRDWFLRYRWEKFVEKWAGAHHPDGALAPEHLWKRLTDENPKSFSNGDHGRELEKINHSDAVQEALTFHEDAGRQIHGQRWIAHILGRLSFEVYQSGGAARYSGPITASLLQLFARTYGAEKPKATKPDGDAAEGRTVWQVASPAPMPGHLFNLAAHGGERALSHSEDEWRDLMQSVGYEVPPAKPKTPPILNFKLEPGEAFLIQSPFSRSPEAIEQVTLTKEQQKKLPKSRTGVRLVKDGTYRIRFTTRDALAAVGAMEVPADKSDRLDRLNWGHRDVAFHVSDSKNHPRPETEGSTAQPAAE